eukprot:scaffold137378_cov27-Tisochrysis_lutea.AAC.4
MGSKAMLAAQAACRLHGASARQDQCDGSVSHAPHPATVPPSAQAHAQPALTSSASRTAAIRRPPVPPLPSYL